MPIILKRTLETVQIKVNRNPTRILVRGGSGGGGGGGAASSITNTPAGNIAATNVQAAINELDSEKAATTAIREKLSADRTYYVRSDGSGSNNGLANTSGGAFATLNQARDAIMLLDLAGFTVTIKIGNTYTLTAGLDFVSPPVGGTIILEGDTVTPTNTTISVTSGHAVRVRCPMNLLVKHLRVQTTTSGFGLYAQGAGATIEIGASVNFGACASAHCRTISAGRIVNLFNNYTISGAAPIHMSANINGVYEIEQSTVTITGTPAFSKFADAENGGVISAYLMTYSGAATGNRYSATANGVIATYGGGASFFPGNVAGSVATGGVYG